MKTQCKLAAPNNIYPRREIAQRFLSIMSLSNNGIKNESNNCWLGSALQILCGTDLFKFIDHTGNSDLKQMLISVKDAITFPKWRRISLRRLIEISKEIGMDVTQTRQ